MQTKTLSKCLNTLLLLLGSGLLFACSSEEPQRLSTSPNQAKVDLFSGVPCAEYDESAPNSQPSSTGLSADLDATYRSSCKICHENPGAGAPLTGDTSAWAPRLAQGQALLLEHSINGYRTMPPLGLCMTCSEQDMLQLIEYMAETTFASENSEATP